MLPPEQKKRWEAFFAGTEDGTLLGPKTTVMIQLAATMIAGSDLLMEHFSGVAKDQGITDNEIGAVQALAMGVSAGRIPAQFRQAREAIGYD
jgi:hypothetical protein